MTNDPNVTYAEDLTPTLFERDDVLDAAPRGGWRIVLAVLVAVALPLEIAWLVKRSDRWTNEKLQIAALNDAARAELAADWERYQKLTLDEQRRLRELHAAIEADADPASLRGALADYEKWKSTLSPPQSAALVGLSPEQRIERLRGLTAEQSTAAARTLSPADAKTIMSWLESQVDKNQEKLLALLPAQARQRFDSLGRRERNVGLILAVLNYRGGGGPRFENLSPEALIELKERLSPEARRIMTETKSLEELKPLLADWIRQAATKAYGIRDGVPFAQRIGDADLQNFFENELSEGERTRLLALPREEMTAQLKREYLRRRGVWKDPQPGEPPQGGMRPPGFKPPGVPGDKRPGFPPGERPANPRPTAK